ncbi:MAG: mevalonate kinase [Chloroflexota bacterium]|nr:mevalonate kinase [Chloroflexota bacterium]
MRVTASAPGKLMLLGEHAVVYGRPCLVTAIDRRMWVTAESTRDGLLHLSAPALEVEDWKVPLAELGTTDPPAGVRFLHAVVHCVAQRYGLSSGLRIETRSGFSHELGLGSSAAVTIATTGALSELLGLELSKSELFALSYEAVRTVQGVGSGFDLAASLHGGTLYFRPQGPEIVPLGADPRLVVGYSGEKADTASLVRCVARRRERQPKLVEGIFDSMARLVEEGREALLARDWQWLGQAMSLSHPLLEALGVSTPKLAQLVRAAEEAGAYGAKLSGAGGGDCMIALVSEGHRDEVARAIDGAGGEVIPMQTGAAGVRRESEPQR